MVFQEETFASRWWPFGGRPSPREKATSRGVEAGADEHDALALADSLEKGLAHEFAEDFLITLPQNGLERFYIERSFDKLQFRLFREGGEFLMYADYRLDNKQVHFSLYDPDNKDMSTLYDRERPAFVMEFNQARTEWMLLHHEDSRSRYSPWGQKSKSGSIRRETQEVAFVRHHTEEIGGGENHCMDVSVARKASLGDSDSSDSSSGEDRVVDRLVTRPAVWNEELQTLVLNFRNREAIPSAKNFQLCVDDRPGRVVLQHVKIAANTFALDFRYPLNISQAFALAVTTPFWK
jgi:hypothetical protein